MHAWQETTLLGNFALAVSGSLDDSDSLVILENSVELLASGLRLNVGVITDSDQ